MREKGKSTESVTVPTDILKSALLDAEELSNWLSKLKLFLGTNFGRVVPPHMSDVGTLNWVVNLSRCLEKLNHCKGFETHVSRYSSKNSIMSAYDVAVIATYLLEKASSVELEPLIEGEKHRQDILVTCRDESVYMECKTIETKKFGFREDHDRMFAILCNYVDVPHQIDIQYKVPLTDTEVHNLAKAIKERLKLITTDGRIIHNPRIEVGVQRREVSSKGSIRIVLSGVIQDLHDQCFYPGHVYMGDGITLSLSGPKVEYGTVLREKIAKSRRQSPKGRPYVLAINCNNILGSWSDSIRAVSSAFQPERNTRFSAVLLVRYYQPVGTTGSKFEFELIANPFAKIPVGEEFKALFRASAVS